AENWWRNNPKWPIWIAVTIFGLVHLVNFEVDWTIGAILAAPFVVSPQLWLGLIFTIGRVRYGWFAGLGLHAAHNLTVWTLSTLIS
ncbi:MAG: CPBP family glutamic-type intramembrane protease, partial [Acidimicrobiales bacterium]|nr:CPBP family glutamic-type intramembrane protease [Acidimicrobiales bacterium]